MVGSVLVAHAFPNGDPQWLGWLRQGTTGFDFGQLLETIVLFVADD